MGIIQEELLAIRDEYGDARRTEILDRDHGAHHRGSPRRRGDGGHHHALRLHQAHARGGVPEPAARRQGRDGDGDQGRGHRRGPLRGVDPLLPAVLHQPWARCTGSRCTRSPRAGARPRARPWSTSSPSGRGSGRDVRARARLRGGRLHLLRHPAGQGEEDRAERLLPPPRGRHPGHRPRGRRRGHRRPGAPTAARSHARDQARA